MLNLHRPGCLLALIFAVVISALPAFGVPINITPTNGTLTVLPASGTNYLNPITISGTASDPAGLMGVFVSVNSSNAFQSVKTQETVGSTTMSFSTSVTLATGSNYVVVKSVAVGGNVSATARVDYNYVPRTAASQTVAPGGMVTLAVAEGLPQNATYQWHFNETNIPGATGSTFVIPSASQADEGLYSVVVTGYFGTLTSSETALRVAPIVLWGQASDLQPPVGLTGVRAIAGGSDHLLALKQDGTVAAWGNWMDGAMPEATNVPPALSNVVAIAACTGQNLVAKSDGTVVCFGKNMPPVPDGLNHVVAVACADSVEVALLNDGTVAQWSSKKTVDPTANGITGVVQIAGGNGRWAALRNDGTVTLYADDGFGNIAPTSIDFLSSVVSISCGGWQCLAVRSDGTVGAFGGDGTLKSGLNNVVAAASPWTTSYALKSDGSLVAWGYNGNGQADVPSGLNVTQVVAGNLYGAALVNSSPRIVALHLTSKVKIDQAPPTVSILTPRAKSRMTAVTLTGNCGEASTVTHVYYKLYSIDVDPPDDYTDVAVTGTITSVTKNKWTYSAPLTPTSGTNVVEVYAVDAWGNTSQTVYRTFVYEIPVPLNLSIGGDGTGKVVLTPTSFSGAKVRLQSPAGPLSTVATVYLGETYTVTAVPTAAASFSNWTGAVFDTSPTISFTVDSATNAQASFIGNRFIKGWKGTYNGLFREAGAVRFESAGALNNLVIGNMGQFSATLVFRGQKYGVAGVFLPTGQGSCQVAVGSETLTVQMLLDFANSQSLIATGSVTSSAGWTANLDLHKTGNGIGGPVGRANLVVTTPGGAVATPVGYGYLQANVTGGGQAVVNGSLSDGSGISGQWGVTKEGKIAFCSVLYGGAGMAWGWLPVAGINSTSFNTNLVWIKKPIVGDLNYVAGFTNDFPVSGSLFTPTVTTTFNGATGTLTFSGGDLGSPLSFPVQLAAKVGGTAKLIKLSGAPANLLTVSVTSKGLVQGTFREDALATSGPSIFGVLLQNQRTINGYWIGNNGLSGKAVLSF